MSGAGWFTPGPAPAHHCSPPPVRTYGPPARRPADPRTVAVPKVHTLPVGSRYGCPCGIVWIVRYRPPMSGPRVYVTGGNEWRREKPAERRKRLGIPRWMIWH